MKRLALTLVVAIFGIASIEGLEDRPRPRLLMISVDGLMPKSYTDTGPAKIPTLRRLAREGAYAEGVIGVLPSVTYPSHTTLMTGVLPAVHGIYDNRILDPEGRSGSAWYWYARDIRVPTLPGVARAYNKRAAMVHWPVTIGMDVDYLLPEYWRSSHPETLKMLQALASPRDLFEVIEIEQGRPIAWPVDDAQRASATSMILKVYRPDVTLLHLLELDSVQHASGPDTQEALAALERIDALIATILQALQDARLAADTNVAIVSDHGFLPIHTRLQPNAAFKEAGLIVADRGRISSWQAYFHPSGGTGYVFLSDPSNQAVRGQVRALLDTLAADPKNGIRTIWTEEDLKRAGAQPGAVFGIDMEAGFYTGGGHDALLGATPDKGGHGFSPERKELHASFIAAGPAFGGKGNLGIIRMTQIAPTLARVLGMQLSPLADEPLQLWGG